MGEVVASHVIPRPHEEVDKLLQEFEKNLKEKQEAKDDIAKKTKDKKAKEAEAKEKDKKETEKKSNKK